MRLILILIFFATYWELAQAQNLIPNPNFEDFNICIEHSAPCAPSGWITPSPFLTEYRGKTNGKHISLIAFNSSEPNIRQYIQTQLMCPLVKGETYTLSLDLKQDECILGSLGVYFTDSLLYTSKDQLISVQPMIKLDKVIASHSKRKQKGWITINTTYKATGEEKYILIGNFQQENEQQRNFVKKQKEFTFYRYSVDNVSLTNLNSDTLCENANAIKKHWYSYRFRHSRTRIPTFVTEVEKNTEISADQNPTSKIEEIQISDVIFEFNASILNDDAKNYIDSIFSKIDLKAIEMVTIEGHTDNIGNSKYNLKLSLERAISVKKVLVEMGIQDKSINVLGKGDHFPIENNDLENGRKKNRRIELFITYK